MSLSFLLSTIYRRFLTLPTSIKDLSGGTVIITGANTGLGFEAAKSIYAMNPAHLILAVRSIPKGEEAKLAILSSMTKDAPPGEDRRETKVDVWEVDLTDFESVKRFASRCERELDRLDILLENAGLVTKWLLTTDGWETMLQTNVLSHFLLATLLMPLMEKTTALPTSVQGVPLKPHLVIVTSDLYGHATFADGPEPKILETLNKNDGVNVAQRYRTTKLLDVLLARELAKNKLFQSGRAVVCSVNPGFSSTQLMRNIPPITRWIMYSLLARTAEEGAKNLLWACLEDNIPPGSYVSSCAVIDPSAYVLSDKGAHIQGIVWKEVGDVLVKVAPETAPIWNV